VASVRGRGYRLVAEVTPLLPAAAAVRAPATGSVDEAAPEPVPVVASGTVAPRRATVRLALLAAGAFAVILAAVLLWPRSKPVATTMPAAGPPAEPIAAPPARSVAVLPFDDLGPRPGGEALALGIAETVLHLLAGHGDIDVTARTSSFAFRDEEIGASDIGRRLNVRYLLQGSVQREAERLRVTAQLVEASSGALVWSVRYDRPAGDVFAMQDEIATSVVHALQLSLDAGARGRLARQGTELFDAYLEYLQGRALLATGRVADVARAVNHFERAVVLDPDYADAYVGQAQSALFVAEYEPTEDRHERFSHALRRAQELIARAIALDPDNAEAYLARAHVAAFDDLNAAEADYRRTLEFNPNAAQAHAGLAAVLYETPARRAEAFALLERAHALDPLEPAHEVTIAVYLLYERSDMDGATALLVDALRLDPQYQPALTRLGEIRIHIQGRTAEGIRLGEQALMLDPASENTRRSLIRAYLSLGDTAAALQLADEPQSGNAARRTPILLYRREWRNAGESAYRSLAQGTSTPIDNGIDVAAIRMHARTTGEVGRARRTLEALAGVTWDASGRPALPKRPATRETAIGLADMLLEGGDRERGRLLLEAILSQMRHEIERGGRHEMWYRKSHSIALALAGRNDEAIAMLQRVLAGNAGWTDAWFFEVEPAYDALREDPSFIELLTSVRARVQTERRELERLRAAGLVPDRGKDLDESPGTRTADGVGLSGYGSSASASTASARGR
jgi:adenylate cyclase